MKIAIFWIGLFFSGIVQAKDFSGEYQLTNVECWEFGTNVKEAVHVPGATLVLRKTSNEFSYDAVLWGRLNNRMNFVPIHQNNEQYYDGTWLGNLFSMVSEGGTLTITSSVAIAGSKCPGSMLSIETFTRTN